ncbi:cytochrome b/b6 domain-containing protein [Prosthecomicrobium hirschii]|uniref:cytochrome b/b6 domain-containing protein n=1 Tax=Prosthecodimorpha hirschii TaxID=665126 RepID=UPI00221E62CB|nr:cytochrome b/b6 domain-containing protein [Prosthecomicrobium hirschii]MCW1843667.1 cytochrome b/b6 domain-containing protein [Prosthecomicrobium hirschii]
MSLAREGVAAPRTLMVWDPLVRLFHWTVVAGCVVNSFVFEDGKTVHRYVGYVVAGALAIRILWGFVGTAHARFTDFVPGPARLIAYLRAMLAGREPRHVGHNPAASVMILTLMALLAAVSVTGWMMTLDAYFGEEWLEDLHELIANAILGLAVIHVLAAIYESMRHRENLILAMITGRKRL